MANSPRQPASERERGWCGGGGREEEGRRGGLNEERGKREGREEEGNGESE